MEFSSDILIESGLNLVGYLIVAALLYLMTARRIAKPARHGQPTTDSVAAHQSAAANHPVKLPPADAAVFVSLASATPAGVGKTASPATAEPDVLKESSRRENRRAIYREARRLLAQGNSRRELLDRFPLTEDEIELLSVTGKA